MAGGARRSGLYGLPGHPAPVRISRWVMAKVLRLTSEISRSLPTKKSSLPTKKRRRAGA